MRCRRDSRGFVGRVWVVGVMLFAGVPIVGSGATLYVDIDLVGDCVGAYEPGSRSCGGGVDTAFSTLDGGLAAALAGDVVMLRAGSYPQLAPPASGVNGNPITIRGYPGERAAVEDLGSEVAIWMEGLSYLAVDGLVFENVRGFGHIYDCDHVVIENCSFDSSGVGTTGSLKVVRSSHCRFVDNDFANSESDQMVLQDAADHNLVQGNTFFSAGHSLLSIRCSEYNVIRENTFDNPDQKAVEVYDCEGVSDAPYRLDSTRRNLIEGNEFIRTRTDTDDHSYNAIQHGAQHTIARHNVVYNCLGGGFNYQHYSDESLFVYANRMYNNTFYDNRCHGIIGDNPNDPTRYFDNRVNNNLLYLNADCSGSGNQIRIPDPDVVILTDNTLATDDPGFVDAASFDLRLAPTSPHIDGAGFVTTVDSAGSGTAMVVADAGFFFDGYGIVGEVGDIIQLEGQTTRSQIVAIDDANNTLTLSAPLTWTSGQGVHLAYGGAAPDPGAHESGLAEGLIFADGFESGTLDAWPVVELTP